MKNPWIFFDLDGTFVRWNYFHLWIKACVAAGLLPRIVLAEPNRRLRAYKNRQGTFRAFTDSLLKAVLDGERLRGIRVDDMERVCQELAARSGRQIHVFCEELNRIARACGYQTAILTGSPTIAAKAFAKQREIGFCFGTELVVGPSRSRYTGEADDYVLYHKDEVIRAFAEEHEVDLTKSIAVGDSEGDLSMLQEVEYGIALNPNSGLLRACRDHGIPYIIEKKNIYPHQWSTTNGVGTSATVVGLEQILPGEIATPLTARLRELDMLI